MSDGFISNKKILTYRIIVHNILCVRIFSLIFYMKFHFSTLAPHVATWLTCVTYHKYPPSMTVYELGIFSVVGRGV